MFSFSKRFSFRRIKKTRKICESFIARLNCDKSDQKMRESATACISEQSFLDNNLS